jgi:Phosphoglycerol transferase and related proteins, alkaline phosphatase superfamily
VFAFHTQKKGYICYTCSMNKYSDNTSRAYPIRLFLLLLAILFALHSKPIDAAEIPLAGRNVIYIHLESFQNFMIGQTLNGIPITPNLNAFTQQGAVVLSLLSASRRREYFRC